MKVLCLIDSLGSGGAQRQITGLALGLKKRGHEVRVLTYHKEDHFLPLLNSAQIECSTIPPCSHLRRALILRRILRQGWQDVVLAFLEASCLYAELARIPLPKWGLVAGERLADPGMISRRSRFLKQFHRLANCVVTNSHTNRIMLETLFPFLQNRLSTIYNAVDLKASSTAPNRMEDEQHSGGRFRVVVAASYQQKKNMANVAKALLILKRTCGSTFRVDWYGGMPRDRTAYNETCSYINEHGLSEELTLHPPTRTILNEFANASAVGLFSFFEGLPNVVCEGMACGKPILLSNVCDAENLVHEGRNGFLCDPASPESIAKTIEKMLRLSPDERRRMGMESRKMAELLFSPDPIIERYESLLECVSKGSVASPMCLPSDVPRSAIHTVTSSWPQFKDYQMRVRRL